MGSWSAAASVRGEVARPVLYTYNPSRFVKIAYTYRFVKIAYPRVRHLGFQIPVEVEQF
jgi:hypothetical protein